MVKTLTQTKTILMGWTIEEDSREITLDQASKALNNTSPSTISGNASLLLNFCNTLDISPKNAQTILSAISFDPVPTKQTESPKVSATPQPKKSQGKYEIHGKASM